MSGEMTYKVRVRKNNARTGENCRSGVTVAFSGCRPEGETAEDRAVLVALMVEGAIGHAWSASHVIDPDGRTWEVVARGRKAGAA